MMDLQYLLAFKMLVEAGSMNRAAAKLNDAQST